MPWKTLVLKPGIDTEMSPTLNEQGWSASQHIRWREGLPEKEGGWTHLTTDPLNGIARGMVSWSDLDGRNYLSVGTNQELKLLYAGLLYDITPYDLFDDLTAPFITTSGSATVQVVDIDAAPATSQWVDIVMPIAVGGILLFGRYQMTTTGGVHTITAAAPAASSTTGGAPPEFVTTNGSADVTVNLDNHGLTSGDTWAVQITTMVGGITLAAQSSYIVTVVDPDQFTFTADTAATSDATVSENGGLVRIAYQLTAGYASNDPAHTLRQWFLDHWGRDLIGCCSGTNNDLGMLLGSPIFVWDPITQGINNHAVAISTATYPEATNPPKAANVCFVIANVQILIALGVEPPGGVSQDPNLVRWCDQADFTDWTATTTNQAGSYRIPTGSRLVGGLRAPLYTVIWTDVDMWLVSYLGFPLVLGFNQVANGVGLIAARACAAVQSAVYWVSPGITLWRFDGNSAQVLPCPVWDVLSKNLDYQQVDKLHVAVNSWFNEFAVFYPSALGDGEVDSYIRYNFREGEWDYGQAVRTCWIDAGVQGPPIGVDGAGILQQHETGYDADGEPMGEFIQSGWMTIADGTLFSFIERVIADFVFTGTEPSVQFWISVVSYPTDTPTVFGPFTQAPTGPQWQIIRARGRLASIKIGASSLGCFWRLGSLRYLLRPAGRR